MRENLSKSLEFMFGHEGGYSNVPADNGGPTKYGITHKTLATYRGVVSVTADQVKALTLTEAEAIYRQNYWTQSGGDVLPTGLDFLVFDMGVNAGPSRAVKILQKVVGTNQDGQIGPQTLSRVESYGSVEKAINDYSAARLAFYKGLSDWPTFGKGWSSRVESSRKQALSMIEQTNPIRELQSLLGVTADGIWGPKSQAALTAFKNTAARVLLLEKEL